MKKSPLKNYGFEYEMGNRKFSLSVCAATPKEARQRVAAMAAARFVGSLVKVNPLRL
jgi:hypothetical protein